MKNVWIVDDEYYDHVRVCSNSKKAYEEMLTDWREVATPPSYATFLRRLRNEYHYSNETTIVYKTEVL